MTRLVLTCLLLLPVYSTVADDLPTAKKVPHADERAAKIVGHYNRLVEAKEWDAAEALALGAQQMLKGNDQLLQSMVDQVRKAKGLQDGLDFNKVGSGKPAVDDSVLVMRLYNVTDLPVWDSGHSSIDEKRVRLLATKGLDPQELESVKLVPYLANESVVVRAKMSTHAKIFNNLRQHPKEN